MKKLLSFCLTVALFVSVIFCLPFCANAQEIRLGDSDTYYSYNSTTKTITISGTGDMPNFITSDRDIPWYDSLENINKIVIDEGVTNVGAYSFYNSSATSISIPSTVKRIGDSAFGNMFLITKIDIPYGVEYINQYAFSGCQRLVDLTLPEGLKVISARAFKGCSSLKEVVIPYSVTSIGMYAFNMCNKLENVVFQSMSSNVSIMSYAFMASGNLKSISVPKNASCDKYFFGYQTNKIKYADTVMNVYQDSNAYNYALTNGINYTLLDTVDTEYGVPYYNKYSADSIDEVHHYTFTADSDIPVRFYTTGSIDVRATLKHNGEIVAECEDISDNNRNICIDHTCQKGETYDLYISSVKYQGEYTLMVLPKEISSITVDGDYVISATDGVTKNNELVFSLDNTVLMNNLFVVEYANGFIHRFVYKNSTYNGYDINIDSDIALNCGANNVAVRIGDSVGYKNVIVEHSYTEKTVEPTPDNDGYTLHKCTNCDDGYKTDYFKTDKTVYTLTGKCVLDENRYGYHSLDIPYSAPTIRVDGREYAINDDGTWEIRTFNSCYIVFDNPYGMNQTIHYSVDSDSVSQEYGIVALDGYDFNADGYVNARDFAIYHNEKKAILPDGYWQFAEKYITTH